MYPSSIHQCTYSPFLPMSHTVGSRLAVYRRWVFLRWFPDLRTAYEADRALYHRWRAREHARSRATYAALVRWHEFRAYRVQREALFAWPRRCTYCGVRAENADHVVPRSQGGVEMLDNLAPACTRCNQDKGSRTPEQWVAWRVSRGLPWPMPGAVYVARP
jgi:5-methylcytosine-specific restriction endonuclease McrA